MARIKPDPRQAAQQRAAAISDIALQEQPRVSSARRELIQIQEGHGFRWVRVTAITQLIVNPGMLGGPFFIRVDGQQIKISQAEAFCIAEGMGIELPAL